MQSYESRPSGPYYVDLDPAREYAPTHRHTTRSRHSRSPERRSRHPRSRSRSRSRSRDRVRHLDQHHYGAWTDDAAWSSGAAHLPAPTTAALTVTMSTHTPRPLPPPPPPASQHPVQQAHQHYSPPAHVPHPQYPPQAHPQPQYPPQAPTQHAQPQYVPQYAPQYPPQAPSGPSGPSGPSAPPQYEPQTYASPPPHQSLASSPTMGAPTQTLMATPVEQAHPLGAQALHLFGHKLVEQEAQIAKLMLQVHQLQSERSESTRVMWGMSHWIHNLEARIIKNQKYTLGALHKLETYGMSAPKRTVYDETHEHMLNSANATYYQRMVSRHMTDRVAMFNDRGEIVSTLFAHLDTAEASPTSPAAPATESVPFLVPNRRGNTPVRRRTNVPVVPGAVAAAAGAATAAAASSTTVMRMPGAPIDPRANRIPWAQA